MNIKKVDDKPMVIHTKEKTKLHVKTAPETKIKAGNVLTVERTPKCAGAEREAKADNKIVTEPDWVHLGRTEDGIAVNSYFVEHPEMMIYL